MSDSDDPFNRPDATSIRPRPGAGRRAPNEPSRPAAPAAPLGHAPAVPEFDRGILGIGLNPIVQAASPVLLLAGRLRGSLSSQNVQGLRRHALDEIKLFEEQARRNGVRNEFIVPARYAICAALDEAVLSTPWGAQSEWSQHPLLVDLHREAWGGEKFFSVLDRMSAEPALYIDLMELHYLCLAFGFAGKYQQQERGHERLAEVQQELYRKIREQRGGHDAALSPRWRGLEDRRNPLVRYVPWWLVGAAMLAVLAIAYTAYYVLLGSAAAPVQATLAKMGLNDFSPVVAAAPVPGPTLKQLLAADEQAGTISVIEEPNGRTVVTPLARNLFGSGSAEMNPAYQETLQHIAKALNQVPGRVLVVGHTDDQRLSSFRYRDNFELSRERAVSVVKILETTIDNRGRFNWNGVGSSEPRYRPESDPANRDRNRRVEIIHVRGT